MARIHFLNRYFPPDHSATSQLLGDVAYHLAASGHEVHVITSQQLYDQPKAKLLAHEVICGVEVHRVPSTRFGRSNLLGRALDYLSYYLYARRSLLAQVRRGDIVVAMTDPPLVSIVAMAVARKRDAHLVNWLQDIYPEIAVELGVPLVRGLVSRILSRPRSRCLAVARTNVVVGERMAEKVKTLGAPAQWTRVIPNWCDDDQVVPVAPENNPLRREWGLQQKFVVGYSGNLGRAHEFDTILAAAERLRSNPNIVFLLIGGGHQFSALARLVAEHGLKNFRFIGYQDRSALKFSLGVPDIHWISLRPQLEGLIVPSKVYGIAAAGRPIIAICAKDGEIARLVQQYDCGVVIEPGDSRALAATLSELANNFDRAAEFGRRARAMLDAHFTRKLALDRWRQIFEQAAPRWNDSKPPKV